jgi:protocatechuate 3,4-dioxygenase beta subunit
VLFAGGRYIDDNGNVFSNDVDVFACNEDGVYQKELTQFTGPGRYGLAATTIRCNDGNEYAIVAGGGYDVGNDNVFSNDVDVFACNADGVYQKELTQFTGPARASLAATTIRCNDGKEYALIAGGDYGNDEISFYSNDVDVFACNADGVYQKELTQFTGPGRSNLAATTITCGNDEYVLIAGGVYKNDGNFVYSNDVDVFACNADGVIYQHDNFQFTGPARAALAATTITCPDGKQYALFAGGYDGVFSNDVDVFACNDDGKVYHKEVIQFTGPARAFLAATTITIDCKQYALFMGGVTAATNEYTDAIDIYDCETGEFLPQPSSS